MASQRQTVLSRSFAGPSLGQFDYPRFASALYTISDLTALALGAILAMHMPSAPGYLGTTPKLMLLLGLVVAHVYFGRFGLYDSWRGRSLLEQASRIFAGWAAVMVTLITAGYVLGISHSLDRQWLLGWFGMGLALLVVFRLLAALGLRLVRARGWNHKRVAVVGGGEWAEKVIRRLNKSPWLGLDVVAVLDEDRARHGEQVDGVPVKGGFELLPALVDGGQLEEVWISLPVGLGHGGEDSALERVLHLLRHSTVTQRLVPNFSETRLLNLPMTQILDLSVVNLNVSPMRDGTNRMMKAVQDRLLALLVLLVLSPLMGTLALLVKLTSRGPVIFKQMRHGWDGRTFEVYKFRTMYLHEDELRDEGRITMASSPADPRITPIGRFLRRTSLDELPQFINVLQGRMSVVGPRPHPVEVTHYYMDQIDDFMQRHKVKPGITGWAQVNGYRGGDDLEMMKRRIQYDLYYIENWSFWFDIRIILLTIVRGFIHPNAF